MSQPNPVHVRVPAKINLHLAVGPLRGDGFHELSTVFQAISLYDEITAWHDDTLSLTMEGEGTGELAHDDSNLVIRAARALASHARVPAAARLHLRKQIPLAAGLAGGSADAAATLVACDALWDTRLSGHELASIAATLGSDVPFLIRGGTALGIGRGEAVKAIPHRPTTWYWVLAIADSGLSTPDVYAELDRLRAETAATPRTRPSLPAKLLVALRERDPAMLAAALGNDLQPAALSLRPDLARTLSAGQAAGALASIIAGSGPTCVFLARDAVHSNQLANKLAAEACHDVRIARGPVPGARSTV
ncbi:4-(cytidine 5'-diphospho)-2-C-methyl-D-erythritol kinase [Phytohabitans flavus]|uniref:4-diphosphocytidyl-2-C-methyl-D-erythritol kinase n=1 Tax=Phytohabitans flavus TaxID=1076124 RepID=A0A6F8XMD5_9ACTN|nr:4-(cytidine 5'-diphospho)-2-C-methyl-D-erythritol kinase [Phytohabitans flavus]BCB74982.1 4-diphosphocytidyl-2-C-methyl-D-erythritol kinase [Phytohabitans flavus]